LRESRIGTQRATSRSDVGEELAPSATAHPPRRAVGYSYDAAKIFRPAGAKKPIYAPYVEHVPPDVTACIFWLKNR
jgi:hypothetical protein